MNWNDYDSLENDEDEAENFYCGTVDARPSDPNPHSWLNTTSAWFRIASTLRRYTGMVNDWTTGIPPKEVEYLENGEAVSSLVRHAPDFNTHKIALDIDLPAALVPSSTPGHFHLYIDKSMPWHQYVKVLDVLAEVGVLSENYVKASKRSGYTALRTPWTKKIPGDTSS